MKETSNLKVVPPMAPRSPEREALAAAIVKRQAAQRELTAAEDARGQAQRRRWDADTELSKFRMARDEEPPENFADDLISHVKDGTDYDVAVIGRRDVEAREREAELQNAADVWTKAQRACEAAIPDRRCDLEWADRHVVTAARKVIAAHPEVEKLLAEAKKIRDDLDLRQSELLTVLHLVTSSSEIGARLNDELARGLLIDERQFPICGEWNSAFNALQRDADAPLPTAELA